MQKVLHTLFFVLLFFCAGTVAYAQQSTSNNKFGIHLAQPNADDIKEAAELVNSQGGDWGYVTLVIQENDRDKGKWQSVFDDLRKRHLIPIIRIATNPEGAHWRRPAKEDAVEWASFLDSLNWVVKDRYIILFNEPNHAGEWGGSVDAEDYAKVAQAFAKKLKEKNSDFVIMPAGIDASAPQSLPFYEDEASFLQKMVQVITPEKFNELFSGLSSHSYPNPGFSGNPASSGRGTIRTYEWELDYLKNLGIKELPVFITETGWSADRLSRDTVSTYLMDAFQSVWNKDDRVVAVTPFILNYQGEPFLQFSWKLPEGQATTEEKYYPQFKAVQELSKVKGEPMQEERGFIVQNLPSQILAQSTYHFNILLRNMGQGYWDADGGYNLVLKDIPIESAFFSDIRDILPNQSEDIDLYLKTANTPGKYEARISLLKNNRKIIDDVFWNFEVLPLPDLNFDISLYPKVRSDGNDFEIQIFNENEELVFRRRGVRLKDGRGTIEKIQNIALGKKYRVVVLKPQYLPRQEYYIFKREGNEIQFKEMLPFDFNSDGALTFEDLGMIIANPQVLTVLLP